MKLANDHESKLHALDSSSGVRDSRMLLQPP